MNSYQPENDPSYFDLIMQLGLAQMLGCRLIKLEGNGNRVLNVTTGDDTYHNVLKYYFKQIEVVGFEQQ